jgi:hypothetical protein
MMSLASATAPGSVVTAAKAASVRSGRPGSAAEGSRYAWTTSRPVRGPVLRTTTVRLRPASGAIISVSAAADTYAHVV